MIVRLNHSYKFIHTLHVWQHYNIHYDRTRRISERGLYNNFFHLLFQNFFRKNEKEIQILSTHKLCQNIPLYFSGQREVLCHSYVN